VPLRESPKTAFPKTNSKKVEKMAKKAIIFTPQIVISSAFFRHFRRNTRKFARVLLLPYKATFPGLYAWSSPLWPGGNRLAKGLTSNIFARRFTFSQLVEMLGTAGIVRDPGRAMLLPSRCSRQTQIAKDPYARAFLPDPSVAQAFQPDDWSYHVSQS
jgi:hypothetical protein